MREIDQTWFKPLPKQAEALAAREREVVYAGGVGAGKTLVGGFKALKVAMTHPGTVGLIARQTAGALAANTQKVILEGDDKPPIIPAELIAHRSEKGTTRSRCTTARRSSSAPSRTSTSRSCCR
jgi:hypothetical protein